MAATSTVGTTSAPGGFTVEDGLLTTHGGMGLLWYTGHTVGDAVLRVVYHVRRPPDLWFAVHDGYGVVALRAPAVSKTHPHGV